MKSHCKHGHPLTEDTVYLCKGVACCRVCARAAGERRRRSKGINAPRRLTDQQIEQIIELYTQEVPLNTTELSKRFRTSTRTVCRILRERDILRKPWDKVAFRIVDGKRMCSECKQWKSVVSDYGTQPGRNLPQAKCRNCKSKKAVQTQRIKKYGLSESAYKELLMVQAGVCAICGRLEQRVLGVGTVNNTLAVDHDHKTGRVRGLLCTNCNKGLGMFQDDYQLLLNAVDYLRWQEKES